MTLQEYNDMYKEPFPKKITLVDNEENIITNNELISESMSVTSSLCSESNLRYGACEATVFKIQIANTALNFSGKWIDVYIDANKDPDGFLITSSGDYLLTDEGDKILYFTDVESQVKIGHFKVMSDKPTNDRKWRELICYDRMHDILNADVSAWYNALTFPMTLKQFRDSFFHYLGVTQETVTLLNDDYSFNGQFMFDEVLSAKDVITAICEINGVFGHMTPQDKFSYIDLSNAEELTLDYYIDGTGTYQDYVTDAITGIIVRGSSEDDGVTVGTDVNPYIIQSNPLTYKPSSWDDLEDRMSDLLDIISTQTFRPFTVTTYGNPALPLGTRLTVETRNQTIESYVISKSMTGIQSLRDTYTASSESVQPTSVNSISKSIEKTLSKVIEASRQVVLKVQDDGTLALVQLSADASTGETSFVVKAGNFEVTREGNVNILGNLTSKNTLKFRTISDSGREYVTDFIKAEVIEHSLFEFDENDNEYRVGLTDFRGHEFIRFTNNGSVIPPTSMTLNADSIDMTDANFVRVGYSFTGINGTFTGDLTVDGTIHNASSRKIKKNIKPITDAEANRLLEINPVSFDFIAGHTDQRGFIAEEVEEIYPNLVNEETGEHVASLNYIGFIPYLVKLCQMQQKKIDSLEKRLANLEELLTDEVIKRIVERGIE